MTVTVLGTSAALPAHGRSLSATLVDVPGRTVLLDCGEGTQVRLAAQGVSPLELDAVFVTHLHGDHVYGLPGLLTSMALLGRTAPLVVAGPDGIAPWLAATPGSDPARFPFALDLRTWDEGDPHAPDDAVVYEDRTLRVVALPLDHRVATRGYRLETPDVPGNLDVDAARALGLTDWRDYRALKAGHPVTTPDGRTVQPADLVSPATPGPVLAYALDTRPCAGAVRLAARADLVVHDATFADDARERARETFHSTAREAATVATEAGARRLVLTHVSARYPDAARHVAQAQSVFGAAEAAVEGDRLVLAPGAEPAPDAPGAQDGPA